MGLREFAAVENPGKGTPVQPEPAGSVFNIESAGGGLHVLNQGKNAILGSLEHRTSSYPSWQYSSSPSEWGYYTALQIRIHSSLLLNGRSQRTSLGGCINNEKFVL